MKSYNSVSVGCNQKRPEEGLFISFYNEDANGNEIDSLAVNISLETAKSLRFMLEDTLKRFDFEMKEVTE